MSLMARATAFRYRVRVSKLGNSEEWVPVSGKTFPRRNMALGYEPTIVVGRRTSWPRAFIALPPRVSWDDPTLGPAVLGLIGSPGRKTGGVRPPGLSRDPARGLLAGFAASAGRARARTGGQGRRAARCRPDPGSPASGTSPRTGGDVGAGRRRP